MKRLYTEVGFNYELKKNKERNKPKVLNEKLVEGKHFNPVPNYKKYVASSWWRKKRREAIKAYESCVLCASKKNLEVHHRTYKNLNNEDILKDLIVLCERCHAKYHYWKSGKKYQNRKRRKNKKPIIWRG